MLLEAAPGRSLSFWFWFYCSSGSGSRHNDVLAFMHACIATWTEDLYFRTLSSASPEPIVLSLCGSFLYAFLTSVHLSSGVYTTLTLVHHHTTPTFAPNYSSSVRPLALRLDRTSSVNHPYIRSTPTSIHSFLPILRTLTLSSLLLLLEIISRIITA